jgi:hypothetical protein
MWLEYEVIPFWFIPGRHPERLSKLPSSVRLSDIFMRVIKSYDPSHETTFSSQNKNTLSEDPGGDYFMVSSNLGTGDIFYFSPNLSCCIKSALEEINKKTSEKAIFINKQPSVQEAMDKIEKARKRLFEGGPTEAKFDALVKLEAERIEAIAAVCFILII